MTVVPLFCARFIKAPAHHGTPSDERAGDGRSCGQATADLRATRFNIWFNDRFEIVPAVLRPDGGRSSCAGRR